MRAAYLACVALHIFAAMVWIGGMAFMVFVLMPSLRTGLEPDVRVRLLSTLAMRFRNLGWLALGSLVVTGAGNLWLRGVSLSALARGDTFRESDWGRTLGEKLVVVALILAASAAHDFWIGPRAMRLAMNAPSSRARERMRATASWAGRINFALALVVLALAVQLVR